jgi:hypothetical protein
MASVADAWRAFPLNDLGRSLVCTETRLFGVRPSGPLRQLVLLSPPPTGDRADSLRVASLDTTCTRVLGCPFDSADDNLVLTDQVASVAFH